MLRVLELERTHLSESPDGRHTRQKIQESICPESSVEIKRNAVRDRCMDESLLGNLEGECDQRPLSPKPVEPLSDAARMLLLRARIAASYTMSSR
jgi:hypothetical protein